MSDEDDQEIVVQQLIISRMINKNGVGGFRVQGTSPFNFMEDIGLLTVAQAELFRLYTLKAT